MTSRRSALRTWVAPPTFISDNPRLRRSSTIENRHSANTPWPPGRLHLAGRRSRSSLSTKTSGAFTVVVAIPKSAISIQGQLKTFNDIGDSGQPVLRNFCPECGSPITSEVAIMPDLTFIKAGTLDDTSWLDPKIHVYCDSAQRWTPIPEGSQKFAKMPT